MKINYSNDPKEIGYNAVTDTATIFTEDKDWMKELIANIKRTKDKAIIRQAERDFHDEMLNRYGSAVAGELLFRLWRATSQEEKHG